MENKASAEHEKFMNAMTPRPGTTGGTPRPRPGSARSQRPGSAGRSRQATPRVNETPRETYGQPRSVTPAFVFKRSAMPNIMEWMQTSADPKERADFKRMHNLLSIDTTANPEQITDNGVHVPPPPSTPGKVREDAHAASAALMEDPELDRLNQGLNVMQNQIQL